MKKLVCMLLILGLCGIGTGMPEIRTWKEEKNPDGTHTLQLGKPYIWENHTYFPIQKAYTYPSLRRISRFRFLHLDRKYGMQILDWNATSIYVQLSRFGWKKTKIPFRIFRGKKIWKRIDIDFRRFEFRKKIRIQIPKSLFFFGKFGNHSTTIMISLPNSEILEDGKVKESAATKEYGAYSNIDIVTWYTLGNFSQEGAIKINLSKIPPGKILENATLCLNLTINALDSGDVADFSMYRVYPFPRYNITNTTSLEEWEWCEGTGGSGGDIAANCEMSWENRPQKSTEYNYSRLDFFQMRDTTPVGYICWDVLAGVQQAYSAGEKNITFLLRVENDTGYDIESFSTKEAVDSPYLNVTYSAGTTSTIPTTTTISSAEPQILNSATSKPGKKIVGKILEFGMQRDMHFGGGGKSQEKFDMTIFLLISFLFVIFLFTFRKIQK